MNIPVEAEAWEEAWADAAEKGLLPSEPGETSER